MPDTSNASPRISDATLRTPHVYGDNIDTDRIIPGKYTKTLDLSRLAAHVLEDVDPGFRTRVKPGDILVAGENFGSGSSREQAPLAIKASGISVVVAKSFSRIFFRNAINVGLPLMEIPGHKIRPGAKIEINLETGTLTDHFSSTAYEAAPLPKVMVDILAAGGLVPYLMKEKGYNISP